MTRGLLARLRTLVAASSFVRFLISGGINTGATYAVYLVLLRFVGYKLAYTIAYVFGIALAFFINRIFVFQTHRGWRSVALFPLVYLAQYLVSLTIAWLWVDRIGLPAEFVPLVAIVVTLPLTFALSRLVFGQGIKEQGSAPSPQNRRDKHGCSSGT